MSGAVLRIRRLAHKELRQLFRDPRTKRIIFGAPIIQLLAFGYAVNTDVHGIPTVVQDDDRSAQSRELVQRLTSTGHFRVVDQVRSPRQIETALDRGRASVAVVIPPRFAADLAARRPVAVQVLVDGSNSNTAVVAQGYASRMIRAYGADRTATPDADPALGLRARAWFNPDLVSRVYNVPAVIGMIVMLMSMLLTALAVVRERELGTMDQLLVSPLQPAEILIGKTLPVAAVAMAQLALVLAVALLWFRIPFHGSLWLLLVAAVVFILAGLSVGLLVSTVSRTQQEAFLGLFLVLFPVIILSGFLYPVDTMPWMFERLSLANPLRHFLDVVRAVFLKGAGWADLWTPLVVLTGMALGGLTLAARRFARSIG